MAFVRSRDTRESLEGKKISLKALTLLHENLLERTPEAEIEKRQALQDSLDVFHLARTLEKIDPNEWYFGKNDETYEGEFTQTPLAKGN